ncbi:MAG: hypothetical protein PHI31_08525 [Desulfuromonadaceae bacterium]|nr:hypothetical protein [Desulfuromonadaceae bacterium]
MGLRHSDMFALLLILLLTLAGTALIHAERSDSAAGPGRQRNRLLVSQLRLTDLCLTTEAPYTRNPSQADRYAPFQDHPVALEHFPSGSLIAPPPHY